MRGYQKVPYPLGTPEWESFLRFAEKHYNEAVRIAVNVTLANCGAGSTTTCLLYTSPSPRDLSTSRMPSSA